MRISATGLALAAVVGLAACRAPVSTMSAPAPTREGTLVSPTFRGVSLTGTLNAPAGVVANNAAGLVANNGGGLVANNAAGLVANNAAGLGARTYHTLAIAEAPLAGADVYLATADGRPIPGLAPVRTDAQGRFVFQNVPKGFSFMVATPIKLESGDEGRLATLARVKEAATTAKISLASTLVTAALTDGRSGTVGSFTPETFDKALQATQTRLEAADVAAVVDAEAAKAKVEAVAQADAALKTSLATLKAEVATVTQSVADLTKAVAATQASAAPASPAPTTAAASTEPAASAPSELPSPTPTPNMALPTGSTARIAVFAGASKSGYLEGDKAVAQFTTLGGVARGSDGSLYVADIDNHRIRKIAPTGAVTTLAGSGVAGFADGVGPEAQFDRPWALAIDDRDTLYVGELNNHAIRTITPDGTVRVLAGAQASGKASGTGDVARFYNPRGFCWAEGALWVADTSNSRICKVTPDGVVTTVAGGAGSGFAEGKPGKFRSPQALTMGPDHVLYVSDTSNHSIRAVAPDGTVKTIAGGGAASAPASGAVDGVGAEARFASPYALVYTQNRLVVCDYANYRLRTVTLDGAVKTLLGNGAASAVDGDATKARLKSPRALALAPDGTIYLTETTGRLRLVTP